MCAALLGLVTLGRPCLEQLTHTLVAGGVALQLCVAAPDVQEREACLTALTAAATPACAADVLRDVARKSAGATVASLRAVTAAAGIHATRQGVVAPLDTGFESGLETLRVRVEVV